jgi:hypothetical protein
MAELQRQFVDGPVLVVPRPRNFSFAGDVTPLGTAGSIYSGVRATFDWGQLVATTVLISADGQTMVLPAPTRTDGATLTGEGWELAVASGWRLDPGPRPGDVRLVRGSLPPEWRPEAP